MRTCITCGMPFAGSHAGDVELETPEGPVCLFDSRDGQVKPAAEVFEGGVAFFNRAVADDDRELAARLTRRNMKGLPYWQSRPFPELDGPASDDAEFGAAMAKLAGGAA